MEFLQSREGDVLLLSLAGHLDTAAAQPLEEQVLQLIEDGARQVLIDCAPLEYVNSSGLKVFLLAAKRLEALGGKLVICALAPNVQMIFEMIGFTKILQITATREEALALFQSTPASA